MSCFLCTHFNFNRGPKSPKGSGPEKHWHRKADRSDHIAKSPSLPFLGKGGKTDGWVKQKNPAPELNPKQGFEFLFSSRLNGSHGWNVRVGDDLHHSTHSSHAAHSAWHAAAGHSATVVVVIIL